MPRLQTMSESDLPNFRYGTFCDGTFDQRDSTVVVWGFLYYWAVCWKFFKCGDLSPPPPTDEKVVQ